MQMLLFGMMLIVMLLRVFLPVGRTPTGSTRQVVSLTFRERLHLQRFNIYAIGAVLLLTAVAGETPLLTQLVVMTAVLGILFLPVRYRLTDEGIGLNNVVFRRWEEFRELHTGDRGFRLVGGDGAASFTVYAMPRLHPEVRPALQFALGHPPGPKASTQRKRRSS